MARNKSTQGGVGWKALMEEDDLFKEMVKESIQQHLEAEMDDALGASRWEPRLSAFSRYRTRGQVKQLCN